MKLEWWYWLILGFCLIGFELVVPSFTIIWFGMGAIFVGVVAFIFPMTPVWLQVLLWAGASVAFTLMWFKYLRPRGERTRSGLSKEAIVGESGMIIRGTADSYGKGIVKFRMSILGADEWTCYSDEPLAVGDNVRVIDIEGQVLKVTKL